MKTDLYFDECKNCEFRDVSDDLMCCMANKLGQAFHNLFTEIPIIRDCVHKHKFCQAFVEVVRDD